MSSITHNAIKDPEDLSENEDLCNDTIPETETSDNENSFNDTIPETECSDNDDLFNTTIPETECYDQEELLNNTVPESETEDLFDQDVIPESEAEEYENTNSEELLIDQNESPEDFNESEQSMDESSECETTTDEDPTDLRIQPQRPDPTDRITFKDKCPTDIRKLANQIPRRYDSKIHYNLQILQIP